MKTFLLQALLLPPCTLLGTVTQAQGIARVWTAESIGFEERAVLTSVGKDFIVLKPQAGDPKKIRIEDLSDEDQKAIAAAVRCEESARVFVRVDAHRSRFATSPEAVADLLKQLHEMHEGDFAAGFFSGTLNAFTRSPERLSTAKKNLNEAISRIKDVRESFPAMHQKTLAAALNNRGVIALREGSPSQAAKYFLEATETADNIPFAVYHNATLLLEFAILAGKSGKFSKSDQNRLTRAIAKASPDSPNARVPKRFVYSLDHDKFTGLIEVSGRGTMPAASGASAPVPAGIEPGLQKLGNGSGFLVAERFVITNRHVVEDLPLGGQVMLRNETSFRDGVIVDVIAISKDEDADLALLRLPNPQSRAKPLPLRQSLPREGEDLAVLGYPLTDVFGETLNSSRGVVSSVSKDGKKIFHDATANPGNSGGPCLDDCGNVLGVLYASGIGDAAGRNFAVSSQATRKFIGEIEKTFAFESEREQELKLEDRIALVKDAVVRVDIYGRPKAKSSPSEDTFSDERIEQLVNLLRLGLLPELTCFQCKGKGGFRCSCGDGLVSEKRQVLKFQDPVTGSQIYDTQVFQVPCPKCSGRAGFECSSCEKGVLPLFE
jgi:S1-C subfamily serine protease